MRTGELQICACCKILDNDETLKECFFCKVCQAWLCLPCSHSPARRIGAALEKSPVANAVLGPRALDFIKSLGAKK